MPVVYQAFRCWELVKLTAWWLIDKPKLWFLALHVLKFEFITTLRDDQVPRNQLMLTKL